MQIYSKMSAAEKWEQVALLRETAWKLKVAGLRAQHPGWSEERIQDEVRRIFLYAVT
ncbi:MAG: hypothetical protein HYR96_05890 [Deltaproteobacteria bacterium]|nr:hypothetical protein [Deltaproteobacteria bacterium]MBI3295785.1 hypothetical protein [Deltaproteobacteria bacterium]